MKKYLLALNFLLLMCLNSNIINAQSQWSNLYCYDSAMNIVSLVNMNDTLYSASYWPALLSKSTDKGKTWSVVNYISIYDDPSELLVFDGTLYNTQGDVYPDFVGVKAFKLVNDNWLEDSVGLEGNGPIKLQLAEDRLFTNTIFPEYGYYTKNSSSAEWSKVNGLTTANGSEFGFCKLGNTYYAVSIQQLSKQTKVWKSTDGVSFSQVSSTGLPSELILKLITHKGCMYASFFNNTGQPAIYKSCDSGANWVNVSPFKTNNGGYCKILFSDSNRLYAVGDIFNSSQTTFSIYYTADHGTTWTNITDTSASLAPNYYITNITKMDSLLLMSQGKYINDTTVKSCIKKYVPQYSLPSSISRIESEQIESVYPNPVKRYLTVQMAKLSEESSVEVINMIGQVVYTTTSKSSSGQFLVLDLESLPDGIYTVKLGSGMQKIVKLK
jgi:photosystem II stability/assembly factor-like uncharacterized protein